jgi:glycosyltransferase involved in cell wall biosynthesis
MRILLLTQWFDPEPIFKGAPFARALRDLGHEVEVLTGFPNYPGGKLYPGYRLELYQREDLDGIPVHRVWLYPSHDQSALRRIANYASFALSAALIGPWVTRRPDVVYVYHPPGSIALAAAAFRAPFVYDIQDLWPDTLAATGMLNHPHLLKLIGLWSALTYKLARHLVVLSPGFRERLIARGVPAGKIDVIPNWCDEQQAVPGAPASAEELGMAGRFNVMFAGTMGKAQALDTVLEGARLLKERVPRVQFVLIGGGIEVERLQARAAELELTNVRFLPRRPVSEIGPIMQLADVLLVHLSDDPLFAITIPSKTQAYMAVGKPILMAVPGDAADLVATAGAGVACPPEDPAALAASVEKLATLPPAELAAMGERGRTYYQQELSLAVGARRFEQIFEAARR